MAGRTLFILGSVVTLVVVSTAGGPLDRRLESTSPTGARVRPASIDRRDMATAYARLPLSFEENRGQADARVRFIARGTGHALSLGADGARLELSRPAPTASRRRQNRAPMDSERVAVQMRLAGSNVAPVATGRNRLPGTVSYFEGRDPKAWRTAIPTYATVRYGEVYPGIDLVYHGNHQQLEYDFVVAPGADPRRIALTFIGADSVRLGSDGALLLRIGEHELAQHPPVSYQDAGGGRLDVASRYVRRPDGAIGFEVGDYDKRRPLIIDPVLAYSTYYGGTGGDVGGGIAVDAAGNIYVTGSTDAGSATSRVFVSKFNAAGTAELYTAVIYRQGCSSYGGGIAVDGSGQAHIAGVYGDVDQFDLCNKNGALTAKLDATGTAMVYSFATGTDNRANAVALDAQGNAYFTGQAKGDWPVTTGAFQPTAGAFGDAFVLALDPAGRIRYSTYLGGDSTDEGIGIAVDRQQHAVVAGAAASNFPTTANAFSRTAGNPWVSGFVTKLNPSGSALVYSTFLGGKQGESCTSVALDGLDRIYVTGSTTSFDFPVFPPAAHDTTCGTDGLCNAIYTCNRNVCDYQYGEDVFVTKIDPVQPGRASLAYSTFLGGENRDLAEAIVVDGSGNAFVTGRTASRAYPMAAPLQDAFGGEFDVFVTQVNAAGTAVPFSTYLGGNGEDTGRGLALDSAGTLYVTGDTTSTSFPARTALRDTRSGPSDAFIATIVASPAPPPPPPSQTPNAPVGLSAQVGASVVTLSWAPPSGGASVTGYALDAGTSIGASNVVSSYVVGNVLSVTTPVPAGTYFVRVRAFNPFGTGPATGDATFTVGGPALPGPPRNLAATVNGTTLSLSWSAPAGGGTPTEYVVDAGSSPGVSNIAAGLSVGNQLALSASVPTGTYYVRIRARNGLGTSAPSNEVQAQVGGGVPGAPRNLEFSASNGYVQLRWDPPAAGPAASEYVVEAGSVSGSSDLGVFAVGSATTIGATVGDLRCFVRVRARNAAGSSPPSNERLVVVSSGRTP